MLVRFPRLIVYQNYIIEFLAHPIILLFHSHYYGLHAVNVEYFVRCVRIWNANGGRRYGTECNSVDHGRMLTRLL